MFYLDVPTTRAASMVVSNETTVMRDKLYDGNAKAETDKPYGCRLGWSSTVYFNTDETQTSTAAENN